MAAQYFRVAETGAHDFGSAHIWAKECLDRIDRFEEIQAIVKLQASVRKRQTRLRYHLHKSTHMLPGSARVVALKIQSGWRMAVEKRTFRRSKEAAITIQCNLRGLFAKRAYEAAASGKGTPQSSPQYDFHGFLLKGGVGIQLPRLTGTILRQTCYIAGK